MLFKRTVGPRKLTYGNFLVHIGKHSATIGVQLSYAFRLVRVNINSRLAYSSVDNPVVCSRGNT